MVLTFIVDSDLQVGYNNYDHIRREKTENADLIKSRLEKGDIKALIVTGDLTQNSADGKSFLFYKYGGETDQMTPLFDEYINPLKNSINMYFVPGNHDYYVSGSRWPYIHRPALQYVRNHHKLPLNFWPDIGDTVYSFDLKGDNGELIHFCACDIYPSAKVLKWLKNDLKNNKDKKIVLFHHYNMSGSFSNWWKNEEKDNYYNLIKDFNVILILEGHSHNNSVYKYKDIPVVRAAGAGFMVVTIDDNGSIDAENIR